MTTAGPKPDWYFDPDGGENERYWNGIEWTQHRRSRRPTVSQPPASFSHPADIVDPISASTLDGRDQAGSVSQEGVRSRDADPPTPSSSWSSTPPTTWATSTVGGPVDWTAEADTPPTEKPMPRRRRSSVAYYLFTVLAVLTGTLTLLMTVVMTVSWLFASIEDAPLQLLGNILVFVAFTALWVWLARRNETRSVNPDPTTGSPAAQIRKAAPDDWQDDPDGSGGPRWWNRQRPLTSPPHPAAGPAPTMQPPPSLRPATAHTFSQPLTWARDQVPKVKQFWVGLPVAVRIAAVAAPLLIIVAIIAAIAGNSRDEGSYQYGRTTSSFSARMLWKAAQSVGAETGDYGNVRSPEDACRIAVEVSRDQDTPQAEVVRKLDIKDVIDGCTDVLETDVRLGYLPAPAG